MVHRPVICRNKKLLSPAENKVPAGLICIRQQVIMAQQFGNKTGGPAYGYYVSKGANDRPEN